MHLEFWQYVLIYMLILLTVSLFKAKGDLLVLITGINSIGSQPTAISVLLIGCLMLIECKKNGIDPTIAGGIIGVASNMLTSMFSKQQHINSDNTTTETIKPIVPTDKLTEPKTNVIDSSWTPKSK